MSWIILFFAGLFEVGWAVGLKYTDGFSRPLPTALTIAAMAVTQIGFGISDAAHLATLESGVRVRPLTEE